jgi:hypothetical protein
VKAIAQIIKRDTDELLARRVACSRLVRHHNAAGFFAFLAGLLALAIFGDSRFLSYGADSTITPIFAGGLAPVFDSPRFGRNRLSLGKTSKHAGSPQSWPAPLRPYDTKYRVKYQLSTAFPFVGLRKRADWFVEGRGPFDRCHRSSGRSCEIDSLTPTLSQQRYSPLHAMSAPCFLAIAFRMVRWPSLEYDRARPST